MDRDTNLMYEWMNKTNECDHIKWPIKNYIVHFVNQRYTNSEHTHKYEYDYDPNNNQYYDTITLNFY